MAEVYSAAYLYQSAAEYQQCCIALLADFQHEKVS
jgi:hypothetical protein